MSHPLDRRHVVLGLTTAAAFSATSAAGAPDSLNFLAVGDWGRRGAFHQREVGAAMEQSAAALGAGFILSVGDNFYPDGVESVADPNWKLSFEDVYVGPHLQKPWYVALGNHDYHGEPQAQLDYALTHPRWNMPARYYKLPGARLGFAGVDVFCIDTSPLLTEFTERKVRRSGLPVDQQNAAAQLEWLDQGLAASTAPWKLVFGHHTIRSGGSGHGDTPEMVEKVLPILQRRGVQAYICGHDHDLQHIVRDGMNYILTGAGSEVRPVREVDGTRFCAAVSGFSAFHLNTEALTVEFLDYNGVSLYRTAISRT